MRNIFNKNGWQLSLAAILSFGVPFALMSVPQPARAFFVTCVNCSTTFQQAQQYAKELETAINTAKQLETQIKEYQNMLKQGLSLPDSMFGRITGDLQQMQALYQQSKALSGNLSNFDQQFRQHYSDYDTYLQRSGQSPNSMQDSYKRWSEEGFDAMRVAMQSSGQNVSAIDGEDAMLSQLVARSQNAQGRMQAIQAGNEIAAQQVQQMQKLRLMLNAQIQSQSAWYAQNIERQTLDDAFRQQFHSVPVQHSAYGSKGF